MVIGSRVTIVGFVLGFALAFVLGFRGAPARAYVHGGVGELGSGLRFVRFVSECSVSSKHCY